MQALSVFGETAAYVGVTAGKSAAAPSEPSSGPAWRRLRHELRLAVQGDDFTLVFLPRHDLAHGRPLGAQAQLRWPRRGGGVASATSLMPLLQEMRLTEAVTNWTLRAACVAGAAWPGGQLSIPIAAPILREGLLPRLVAAALEASGLAPERLDIELPEACLADETIETLLTLSALRDLGVGIVLHGFGSFSASLLTLRRLPLTAMTLDRGLVRDLPDDCEAASLVMAACRVARALDVAVIACGVETAAQRDFLRRAGCSAAQGVLFGRALPAAAVPGALAA